MLLIFPKIRILIQGLVVVFGIIYVVMAAWVMLELFCSLARGAVVDNGDAIRNIGLIFIAVIGGPFVAWRAFSASMQAQAAQQGQITERFTKAVEQLAAVRRLPDVREDLDRSAQQNVETPIIDIRIGGLYALERISKDSEQDHIVIMETICAYVRENAHLDAPERSNTNLLYYPFSTNATSYKRDYYPPQDVYVALLILGRRSPKLIKYEENNNKFRLNLSATRLRQLDMGNAQFRRAFLSSTHFTNAYLAGADLTLAWLYRAQFDGTVMHNCTLDGAALPKTDLRKVIELDQENLNCAYGVCEGEYKTLLPSNLQMPKDKWFRPSSPNLSFREFWKEFDEKYKDYCKNELGLEVDV